MNDICDLCGKIHDNPTDNPTDYTFNTMDEADKVVSKLLDENKELKEKLEDIKFHSSEIMKSTIRLELLFNNLIGKS